jgi:alpha-N-arabinofuranosidase
VSSTLDENSDEVIIKAVNISDRDLNADIELQGVTGVEPEAKEIVLSAKSLASENSLKDPREIFPRERPILVESPSFSYEFQPYSLTILRIPIEQ